MSMRITVRQPGKRALSRYVIDEPFPAVGDVVRLQDGTACKVVKLEPTEIIARFARPAIQSPERQQESDSSTQGGQS